MRRLKTTEDMSPVSLRLPTKLLKRVDIAAKKANASRQLVLSSLIASAVKGKKALAIGIN